MSELKNETPMGREVFNLHIVNGLTVGEVADHLDVTHQRITAITMSPSFKDFVAQYYDAWEEGLSVRQKLARMRAKNEFERAVPLATERTIKQAEALDSTGQKARDRILSEVGLVGVEESDNSTKVLVFNIDGKAVESLAELGYTPPIEAEFHDTSHASRTGKEIGEGLAELDARDAEHNTDPETTDNIQGS